MVVEQMTTEEAGKMQVKFNPAEAVTTGEKKEQDTHFGHLALEALKVIRRGEASAGELWALIRKCEAAAAVLSKETIAFAEAKMRHSSPAESAAARKGFENARALEAGFDRLVSNLRSLLP
jgi:hypothetical protein